MSVVRVFFILFCKHALPHCVHVLPQLQCDGFYDDKHETLLPLGDA